jgi:methyltransferase-like protein
MMSVNNFPPEIATMLQRISSDTVEVEQYMDFVRNRMFRQTLLCRREVDLDRNPAPERAFTMHAASDAEPESAIENLHSRDRVVFRRPGSTLTTSEPLVKAAMLHLRELWPRRVPFKELLGAARAKINPGPQIMDTERDQAEARTLADALLRCYATTHVDLSIFQPSLSFQPADRPTVSGLARLQAQSSGAVTNLWHEHIRLTDMQRFLTQRLDGSHDRSSLMDMLLREIHEGRLVVHDKGQPVTESAQWREIVDRILDENLNEIAYKGMLCETT